MLLSKNAKKNRGNDEAGEFEFDDGAIRVAALYKKINLSRFAEAKGISRKTLYKMRDSGCLPRDLLFSMCSEANINPVLVEFSPEERIIYYSELCDYIKDSSYEYLYKNAIDKLEGSVRRETALAISILHDLYHEGSITHQGYEAKTKY